MSVIEELRSEIETEEARAYAAYLTLAKRIADGEKGEAGEVRVVLKAADKSLDDLERTVSLYRARPALHAKIEAAEGVSERIVSARNEIARIDAELEAAKRRHAASIAEIDERIAAMQSQAAESKEAWTLLKDPRSSPDDTLAKEIDAVRQRIEFAKSKLASLTESTFDQRDIKPGLSRDLAKFLEQESELLHRLASI